MTVLRGWEVRGVFEHEGVLHGLVHNPHINDWFHAWWDPRTGRCLMHGADERLRLNLDWLPSEASCHAKQT